MKRYINKTKGLNGDETHVLRACGESFMCPLPKGMMLPISRCNALTKSPMKNARKQHTISWIRFLLIAMYGLVVSPF